MIAEGVAVVANAGFGESARGTVIGTRVTTCGGNVCLTEYLVRFDDDEDLGYFDDGGSPGYMFPGCDGEKAWVFEHQVTPNVELRDAERDGEAGMRSVPLERRVGGADS